jgi:cation diffusion facilitator family transporter
MSGCSCSANTAFDGASAAYRRVLWAVIVINAVMFVVETVGGALAGSMALQADALDFLGDTFTYGLSLWVIGKAAQWRSRAALLKGASLSLMALWILGASAYRVLVIGTPEPLIMGGIGFLALAANLVSAGLLYRFRDGDANVRSVWLCSRNDALGNIAVMGAAGLVWLTGSGWPDLAVAVVMAGLFFYSSVSIFRQARGELRAVATPA